MKKAISFTTLLLGISASAQPYVENFNNASALTATYSDVAFTGEGGIEYTCTQCSYNESYAIDEKGVILRNGNSSLQANYPAGLASLSFQYRKAFTGANVRRIRVYLNDVLIEEIGPFGYTSGADETVYTYTLPANYLQFHNTASGIQLKLTAVNTSPNYQVTIDNITWEPLANLSIKEDSLLENQLVLYPNPTTDYLQIEKQGQEILSYRIYDITGKKQKEGKFTDRISVSELPQGSYTIEFITEKAVIKQQKFVKK